MKAGIYCRECWYDLRGIERRQCPECGHGFDPEQPDSFLYFPGTRLPDEIWSVLYTQGAALLMFLLGLVLVNIDKRVAGYDIDLIGAAAFCFVLVVQLAAMITALIAVPIYLPKVEGRKRLVLLMIGLVPWVIFAVGALFVWVST